MGGKKYGMFMLIVQSFYPLKSFGNHRAQTFIQTSPCARHLNILPSVDLHICRCRMLHPNHRRDQNYRQGFEWVLRCSLKPRFQEDADP